MMQYPGLPVSQLARTRPIIWGIDETAEADALTMPNQVWYVWGRDGAIGADTNSGQTPQSPFLTITKALSMCEDARQDFIVVMSYSAPTGEVWPINVDVKNVHIIGYDGAGTRLCYLTPPADTAGLYIAADRVTIANLAINGGATHGCIENNPAAARWGLLVQDCWLGVLGAGQDGIRNVAAGDNVYLDVQRCRFGYALTRDGIRVEHNSTRAYIGSPWGDGNVFERVGGVGVNLVGNVVGAGIYNNVFVCESDVAGKAVTLSAGCTNNIIANNIANFGNAAMAANPYLDGSGADANHFMGNIWNITLTDPA